MKIGFTIWHSVIHGATDSTYLDNFLNSSVASMNLLDPRCGLARISSAFFRRSNPQGCRKVPYL